MDNILNNLYLYGDYTFQTREEKRAFINFITSQNNLPFDLNDLRLENNYIYLV